jgi:hypothetical protein
LPNIATDPQPGDSGNNTAKLGGAPALSVFLPPSADAVKCKICLVVFDGAARFGRLREGRYRFIKGRVVMFIIFLTVDPELDTATVGHLRVGPVVCRIAAYHTMADVIAKSGDMTGSPLCC